MDLGKMKEMMSQAREMQEQVQRKMAQTVVESSVGGGAVTVRMNGQKLLLAVTIDPSAAMVGSSTADLEMLQDLVIAAVNQAGHKVDEALKVSMAGIFGAGMPPGFDFASLLSGGN